VRRIVRLHALVTLRLRSASVASTRQLLLKWQHHFNCLWRVDYSNYVLLYIPFDAGRLASPRWPYKEISKGIFVMRDARPPVAPLDLCQGFLRNAHSVGEVAARAMRISIPSAHIDLITGASSLLNPYRNVTAKAGFARRV
jgi:hypothetical protein